MCSRILDQVVHIFGMAVHLGISPSRVYNCCTLCLLVHEVYIRAPSGLSHARTARWRCSLRTRGRFLLPPCGSELCGVSRWCLPLIILIKQVIRNCIHRQERQGSTDEVMPRVGLTQPLIAIGWPISLTDNERYIVVSTVHVPTHNATLSDVIVLSCRI